MSSIAASLAKSLTDLSPECISVFEIIGNKLHLISGNEIESRRYAKKYIKYDTTVVKISEFGLRENSDLHSRMIIHREKNNRKYLFVLSSEKLEVFEKNNLPIILLCLDGCLERAVEV